MEILRSVHCPKCGGRVLESAKAYGCENWRDIDGGCKITIWKNTWGHDVTADEATAMFQGGRDWSGRNYFEIWDEKEGEDEI